MFKKIVLGPFFFFRELIFESKEEYDIKSTAFNTKKVLTFCLLVASITVNILALWRLVDVASKNIDLNAKVVFLEHLLDENKITFRQPEKAPEPIKESPKNPYHLP